MYHRRKVIDQIGMNNGENEPRLEILREHKTLPILPYIVEESIDFLHSKFISVSKVSFSSDCLYSYVVLDDKSDAAHLVSSTRNFY